MTNLGLSLPGEATINREMELISDLIKIKSVSGEEQRLAKFIIKYLTDRGFQPILQDNNILLHLKGKNPSAAIIFNAHMDTVPSGNLSSWKYPPFGNKAGIHVGNKFYGLGASDDKAGIASLILLAKNLAKQKLQKDTWLVFVCKEEVDGSGTKNFIKWFKNEGWLKKYKKLSAVICEPTGLKEIKIGHRGNIFVKIIVDGDGGHGSKPQEIKLNSILEAYKVIRKLNRVAKEWALEYHHPILGKPTLAITTISGGNQLSPNKFADSCTLTLDIRTTPEMHNSVITLLKEALKEFKISVELLYKPTPFGYTDPSTDIVTETKRLTGAKITINIGSNDLCFFTELEIPGIIFGPGEHTTIHKVNEYCDLRKIKKAAKIYKQLVI